MQTKRKRLVAETADDLQQILFGDLGEGDAVPEMENAEEQPMAIVPTSRVEQNEEEIFSDSDRDSMDEFIVRDADEDREHRLVQSYSDRYGDDVAESLNDVIAIFGDLRILDIYSQGEGARLKRIASETADARFSPEELAGQMATSKDDEILRTDCPERLQEDLGTAKCMETFAMFEEGGDPEDVEKEWAAESLWLYESLRWIAASKDKSKNDWSLWTPVKLDDSEVKTHDITPDHSAVMLDDYKEDVVKRLHVLLRDIKGRGMDPLLIWHSMAKAKYSWYLNLEDMMAVVTLDTEWTKLWSKYQLVDVKLRRLLTEVQSFIAEESAVAEKLHSEETEETVVASGSARIQLVLAESVRNDLASLIDDMRNLASTSMSLDFSDAVDDISQSVSAEIEPVILFILSASSPTKLSGRRAHASGSVAVMIQNQLHEKLIPLLILSPKEVGDNLALEARVHKGPFAGAAPPSAGEEISAALRAELIEFLSTTLASNVKVRKWFRKLVQDRAVLFTHPITPATATKRWYGMRRLAGKPVNEFLGTQTFLAVHALVALGEVSMDLCFMDKNRLVAESVHEVSETVLRKLEETNSGENAVFEQDFSEFTSAGIDESIIRNVALLKERLGESSLESPIVSPDSLVSDLLYYASPESSYREDAWVSSLRVQVVVATIRKLYKAAKPALLGKLTKDSFSVCARVCAGSFSDLIRTTRAELGYGSPAKLSDEMSDSVVRELTRRNMGHFSVMSVVVEKVVNGFRTHCVAVNHRGAVVDQLVLDAILSPGSDEAKKEADKKRVVEVLRRQKIALITVGVDDRKSRSALMEFKNLVYAVSTEAPFVELGAPQVQFADTAICSRVAKSVSQQHDGDASPAALLAASIGRMHQNPAAEILSLWSDVSPDLNQALTIPLNDLQPFVPKQILHREYRAVASMVVAQLGVDLNDCVASNARRALLAFVPGLGPRKARALIDAADAHIRGLDGEKGESRLARLSAILGERVFRNAQPFLRLVPDCDKVALAMTGDNPRRARSYSSDSDESSSSSDSGSDDSSSSDGSSSNRSDTAGERMDVDDSVHHHSSSDGGFFKVPNRTVESVLEGYSFFELCGFAKECWPVAREVVKSANLTSDEKLFEALGNDAVYAELAQVDFSQLIQMMFDAESTNLPAHMRDPEIDVSSISRAAAGVITHLIIPQLKAPFSQLYTHSLQQPSKQRVFFASLRESEHEFNKWTVVTCTITQADKYSLKATEVSTGLEGWIYKGPEDWARYNPGDSVRCRVTDIDFTKFSLTLSTEPMPENDSAKLTKWQPFMVAHREDLAELTSGLGKVEAVVKTAVKSRRIIKHESFLEIPHAAAVERLAAAPIGDVIFRPSTSHPGQYLGMIKFMGTADSRDASKEDWIKVFRFVEGPSVKTAASARPGSAGKNLVFKMLDSNEEFEEFDQMKVLYVDRYLRYLSELRSHPKFRPEHIDQVKNMIVAKMRATSHTGQGAVQYSLVMDPRRECAGNAVLLWAADKDRVHEDVIEVTNRGFKWWTKGPYPSINALINWWKQGGYKERSQLVEDWKNKRTQQVSR